MQKVENAEQRCHFRRRCNSLPARNFRSQRWIRKHSTGQLLFSLYCYYTRVHFQRGALQKPTYMYIWPCIWYIYLVMRKGMVSSLKKDAVHGSLELVSYLYNLSHGSLHAHCCHNYTCSYACL